jgi:hypothetical protein
MTHIISYHPWRFGEFLHGAGPEKVELQYPEAVLQSNAQVAKELEITKQEINDEDHRAGEQSTSRLLHDSIFKRLTLSSAAHSRL